MNSPNEVTRKNLEFESERPSSQNFGGRLCKFAGEVASVAPSAFRTLKVSVSSLALGSIIASSMIASEVHAQFGPSACSVNTNNAFIGTVVNCSASSMTAAETWSLFESNPNILLDVDLSSSTAVTVSTGTSSVFTMLAFGAGGIDFTQAASGQAITAQSNVPSVFNAMIVGGTNDSTSNQRITISTTGNISVASSSSYAIRAYGITSSNYAEVLTASARDIDVTITTANITGGGGGIRVRTIGDVTISSNNIRVSSKQAIHILHPSVETSSAQVTNSVNVNVSSITVTHASGSEVGIDFDVSGASVSAVVGSITNNTSSGIGFLSINQQDQGDNPFSLSVGSATVNNYVFFFAASRKTGTVTFTATGNMIGAAAADIATAGDISVSIKSFRTLQSHQAKDAFDLTGKNITLSASGTISTRARVINVIHSGNVSITTSETVTGSTSGSTIHVSGADNVANNANVTISTPGDVVNTHQSAHAAIFAGGTPNGLLTVNAVNVTSSGENAISLDPNNGNVNITTAGEIKATGNSTDATAIRVRNITTSNTGSPTVTITLNEGSVIGASGKRAFYISADNSAAKLNTDITVKSSASIIGAVTLGRGNDKLKFAGGSYSLGSGQVINAGESSNDNDILEFQTGSWNLTAANFTNWETLNISSGVTIKYLGKGETNGQNLGFSTVNLNGSLTFLDGTAGDHLDIAGNLNGNGIIYIDVDLAAKTADRVVIAGSVSGNFEIRLTDVTPAGSTPAIDENIRVVSIGTGGNTAAFSLQDTFFFSGNFKYQLVATGNQHLELNSTQSILRCIESSTNLGNYTCSGVIAAPEDIVKGGTRNLVATLDASATVNVSADIAFSIVGGNGITFTQAANGGTLNASGAALGVVRAQTQGNGVVSVTLTGTGNLTGSGNGIFAKSTGTGTITISAAAINATHSQATAIRAEGKGANVSVNTSGTISGGQFGIFAKNTGDTGLVTINTTAPVNSESGTAIYAYGKGRGVSVTVSSTGTADIVKGGVTGIKAENFNTTGESSVAIYVTGNITTTGGDAIHVTNSSNGGININISGNISGGTDAIDVRNEKSGDITIVATGKLVGTGSSSSDNNAVDGIQALDNGAGNISISAQDVVGNDDGVYAKNRGGGSITVTVTGEAEGKGENYDDAGVYAVNDDRSDGITVNLPANAESKGATGIYIRNGGRGGVTLNAPGDIEGVYFDGVYVRNDGTTINVTVRDVNAYEDGVDVRARGTGHTTITHLAGGTIEATEHDDSNGMYIIAKDSGNVTVNMSGEIIGYTRAVYVDNYGKGNIELKVGSDADLTGEEEEGIYVRNRNAGGNVKITVSGEVAGNTHSVKVRNQGSGYLTMSGNGTINNSDGKAVELSHSGSGALSFEWGTLTAKNEGIDITSLGDGTVTVSATSVTSSDEESVIITNSGAGAVSVNITNATAKKNAVQVSNLGAGALTFTSTGTISTTGSAEVATGVDLVSSGNTLTVTVNDVNATKDGVRAVNNGSGVTSVTLNGDILLSGTGAKFGITLSGATAASSTITVNSGATISGAQTGVYANARTTESVYVVFSGSVNATSRGVVASNVGIGDVEVTIDGDITSGSGLNDAALSTLTQGGSATVTINSGVLTGTTAILGDESNSQISLNASAEIKGGVALGGGADSFLINGGKFDNAAILDGGSDAGDDKSIDTLSFTTGSPVIDVANLKNWEKIVVSSGVTVNTSGSGRLVAGELNMGSGGILSLSQGLGVDDAADDSVDLSGNLTGSGIIHLDIDFTRDAVKTDTITIQGNVTGQHKIRLTSVTPVGTARLADGPITVATVVGTADANSIVLENRTFGAFAYVYTLTFNASTKTYTLAGSQGTLRCNEVANSAGSFTCAGTIINPESIARVGSGNVNVTLGGTATVQIVGGVAFSVQGGGNVAFRQEAGGGAITASGQSIGVVHATATGNGTVTINVVGAASLGGSGTAISATGVGTGIVGVNVAAVTANHSGATAIQATGNGASVSINGGAVSGGRAAVVAKNTSSTGAVFVGLTGAVSSSGGTAIDVAGAGQSVTVTASSTVTALTTGVKAVNSGSGSGTVSVSVSGAVTATNSTGIYVHSVTTGDIAISAAAVTGKEIGINVKNDNGGNIRLTSTGAVTASGTTEEHAGIHAMNDERGNGMTLNVSATSGAVGLLVVNNGAGGVSVTANGAVTGTVGDGISVTNSGTTTAITAGSVTAEKIGINLQGNGTGDESISVTAGSTITAKEHGINHKMVGGGNASINVAGTISSEMKAIYVDNTTGTGDVSVTVASGASVAGTHGIHVMTLSGAGSTSLTILGAVSGTESGIHFVDTTDSAVTISGTGSVSSAEGDAIYVRATGSGGVSVAIGSATSSAADGMDVRNVGTDDLTILATGAVTGSGTEGLGINAHNGATGENLSVTAGTVGGVSGGLVVVNEGSGTTTVVATGAVSASGGDGINIDSKETTTGLTVSTTGATGHVGIKAIHLGTGDLTFTDSGSVTGNGTESGAHGIHAQLSASGTNLSLTASSATGAVSGIIADNDGSGTTTVVATGDVVGQGGAGIEASNVSGAGAMSITASGSTGSTWGIRALNIASGTTTTVTTTGNVVGQANHGIEVMHGASLGNITISAAAVSGKLSAIKAHHSGNANISVTTSGRVVASDADHHGIEATLVGTSGAINIVVSSEVVGGGGDGRGIMATSSGQTTTIVLNSGAVVRAASGVAIETGSGRSIITVNEGGTVSGNVNLGTEVDIVTFEGGTLGAVIFDGGEETTSTVIDTSKDVFNLNRGNFDIGSAQFNNFEIFNIRDFATVIVNGNKTLTAEEFTIRGTINMVDSVADDSLTVAGNMEGGGTFLVDADLFSGRIDTLTVTGNLTGTSTIRVTDISQRFGAGQDNNITVVTVRGTANASNFTLHGGSVISGSFQYLLNYDETTKTFNLVGRSTGAPMLLSTPVAFFDGFARAPSLHQRRTDRSFVDTDTESSGRGGWSRLINGNYSYGNAQNGRADYDIDATGFQMGYDFAEIPADGGSWILGVTSQYNEVKAGVLIDDFNLGGTMTATGYGVGATATYYNVNGAYVDLQAQYNNINANFPTPTLGLLMNGVEAIAMVVSMELGQRYRVNDKIALVSHGQVAWGQVDTDNFETEQSQKVAFGADGGLTARIGMGGEYHDERYSSFVLVNLFYDAFNEWNVAFDDEIVTDTVGSTEVELNFGGSMKVDEAAAVFVQAGYRTSIEGGDGERSSTNFSMGMRWSW